jgi:hypothetical protein
VLTLSFTPLSDRHDADRMMLIPAIHREPDAPHAGIDLDAMR